MENDDKKTYHKTLLKVAPIAFWQVDKQGLITEVNEAACEISGYTEEELLKMHVYDIDANDDATIVMSRIEKMMESEEVLRFETKHRHKNGTLYDVSTSAKNSGKGRFIAFFEDITKLKQKEEMLRKSEEKYRLLVENVSDVIWTRDLNLKLTYIGSSIFKQTGFSVEERMLQPLDQSMTPDSVIRATQALSEEIAFENNGSVNAPKFRIFEVDMYKKDGTIFPVEIAVSFIRDETGKAVGLSGINRDITERKQAEKNLLQLQKLESLGLLAGGIAHDFNNLLAGIMGNTSLALMNTDNSKEQDELLKKVIIASEKATALTQQLLTFAKGGIPSLKIASIAEVIMGTVNLFLGQSSQVQCKSILPEDLWLCEMDVSQISQVFQNLIINAKQAMSEEGVIQIQAENLELANNNPYRLNSGPFIHVSVKDSGIGIPEKYLEKIFDPYFSTKIDKKGEGGSGLGLAMSYSVIQKHKGHIYVDSKSGEGSTFHIYIPADKNAVLKEGFVEGSSKTTKSLKVLVMDDNEMILDMMTKMLENFGHQVVLSEHGQEALEKYSIAFDSDKPFDVAILDLTIPGGMGGVETLEKLKVMDPNVITIVSSGYGDQSPVGFTGVLPKPYSMKDIKRVLEEVTR